MTIRFKDIRPGNARVKLRGLAALAWLQQHPGVALTRLGYFAPWGQQLRLVDGVLRDVGPTRDCPAWWGLLTADTWTPA